MIFRSSADSRLWEVCGGSSKLSIYGETGRIKRRKRVGRSFVRVVRRKRKELEQFEGVSGVWQSGVFLPDPDPARHHGRG